MFLTRLVCCMDLDACSMVFPVDAVHSAQEYSARTVEGREMMSTRLGAVVAVEEPVVAGGVVGARCLMVEDVGRAAEEADPAARGEDDALYNRRPCSSGAGAASRLDVSSGTRDRW